MTGQELKIQQQLEAKGVAEFVAASGAMRPLIRPGRDVCSIVPLPHRHLKKGEVILYRREDGNITLGRITKVHRRVSRVRACGDNRIHEKHRIARTDIIGLLFGVRRDGGRTIYTSDILYHLYSFVIRIRTAIVLMYMNDIYLPTSRLCKKIFSAFGKNRYQFPTTGGGGHHHHHHSSSSQYKASRRAWSDLVHAIKEKFPGGAENFKVSHKSSHSSHRHWSWRSLKSSLKFWKKDYEALKVHHGQYFLFGFRMPWVPEFLLKKYGLRKLKSVNNNIVTQMDWTIHSNEFKMPYNMSMQTLSMGVFVVLVIKLSLAVWWLAFFLIYGNENSSRIYMYNLLITATWFPIALFFLAYFFHLNKILYMSIQRVTLMAAVICLARVLIFVVKLVGSDGVVLGPNLVTLFNAMEIVCWVCLSGFFFIMHYKMSGRKDFIPHFWESNNMTEERRRKKALKDLKKRQIREQQLAEENHEQHYHIEH